MRRGIGRLRAKPASSTDADALAWAAAVTANSGTYSAATLAALSTRLATLRAAGLWPSKFAVFNPVAGNQLAAALVQYKSGTWASATNVNFVSGDYTEATGLAGNGSNKLIRTGLLGSALTLNSTHIATYNRSNTTGGTNLMWSGVSEGATNRLQILAPHSDSKAYSDQYSTAGGRTSTAAALTGPYGRITGTRTAANLHTIYQNGASVASNATTGGALPSLELYVMAVNVDGVATGQSGQICAGYEIGLGLSAAEEAICYSAEQTFQTALGRNV